MKLYSARFSLGTEKPTVQQKKKMNERIKQNLSGLSHRSSTVIFISHQCVILALLSIVRKQSRLAQVWLTSFFLFKNIVGNSVLSQRMALKQAFEIIEPQINIL